MAETRVESRRVSEAAEFPVANEIAFRVLQVLFVIAPTLAGLDKFFFLMTDWDKYLAPPFARLLGGHTFLLVAGVVEIVAGLIVAAKPQIGGYIVSAWLLGIVVNLVVLNLYVGGGYWDIALRDLGLSGGAFALGQLAVSHQRARRRVTTREEVVSREAAFGPPPRTVR